MGSGSSRRVCRNPTVSSVFWMSGSLSFSPVTRRWRLSSMNWYFLCLGFPMSDTNPPFPRLSVQLFLILYRSGEEAAERNVLLQRKKVREEARRVKAQRKNPRYHLLETPKRNNHHSPARDIVFDFINEGGLR